MTPNTRNYDRFEYHAEDIECQYCIYNKQNGKKHKTGCCEETCRYEGIRRDAEKNNRINRKRGWFNGKSKP